MRVEGAQRCHSEAAWRGALSRAVQAEALPPVQVACAAAWTSAHERRLKEGAIRGWDASFVAMGEGTDTVDWTYTTPYGGSVRSVGCAELCWRAVDERIDRSLLLARDPILFYDELTLYESELDDNGSTSLTVKVRDNRAAATSPRPQARRCAQVRVMPSCWFVLMRYWLRVDGVLVRCVAARAEFAATL